MNLKPINFVLAVQKREGRKRKNERCHIKRSFQLSVSQDDDEDETRINFLLQYI